MNITVINIRDLIKCIVVLCIIAIILVAGVKVVNGKEEFESAETKSSEEDSSFLYCLEMELPIMANDEQEEEKNGNILGNGYKFLDTELEMLYNINENIQIAENTNENIDSVDNIEQKEEDRDRTVNTDEKIDTAVIEENNITPSFTNSEADIQVKNQSSHDITDLIKDANYEIKNKNKIIIYHTHTCESYTASENYGYEMTGAYRTTDLKYTVAKVRR